MEGGGDSNGLHYARAFPFTFNLNFVDFRFIQLIKCLFQILKCKGCLMSRKKLINYYPIATMTIHP